MIRDGRGFLPQNFFLERSPKNRTLQVPAHHPFSLSGREQTKPAEDGENFFTEVVAEPGIGQPGLRPPPPSGC
jgi:hypothetical protein